jgi:hypothetical protein
MGVMLSMVVDEFHKGKVFHPCFRVGMAIDLKICCRNYNTVRCKQSS